MDLKADDISSIVLDPALLLSYELDQLHLDAIPSDIFDFPEDIPQVCESLAGENVCMEGKSCASERKLDCSSRRRKRKDINGKEESSCEHLNELFDKLHLFSSENIKKEVSDSASIKIELPVLENIKKEVSDSASIKIELPVLENSIKKESDSDNDNDELSDSDNEGVDENCSSLIERAPIKKQSRAKKNRFQKNIFSKDKSRIPDKSQFNPEALKFLSGSNQVVINAPSTSDEVTAFSSFSFTLPVNESVCDSSIQEHYTYDESRAKIVSSPESGYESSSALSGSSSPPLLPLSSPYLDLIPESVDEQNILDFLAENTADCALKDNLSVSNSDDKYVKGKINEIINYLKDIPEEKNTFPDTSTNNVLHHVPSVNTVQDLNFRLFAVSASPVPESTDTPKKLGYKLKGEAKDKLRKFLCVDEFYAAEERIYRRINGIPKENVKVIYVEDENESENRTNLHLAVLDSRIEDIYCLVEIHKQYDKELGDINIRDKDGKTALDYAIEKEMTLVVDYLRENTACQSVKV